MSEYKLRVLKRKAYEILDDIEAKSKNIWSSDRSLMKQVNEIPQKGLDNSEVSSGKESSEACDVAGEIEVSPAEDVFNEESAPNREDSEADEDDEVTEDDFGIYHTYPFMFPAKLREFENIYRDDSPYTSRNYKNNEQPIELTTPTFNEFNSYRNYYYDNLKYDSLLSTEKDYKWFAFFNELFTWNDELILRAFKDETVFQLFIDERQKNADCIMTNGMKDVRCFTYIIKLVIRARKLDISDAKRDFFYIGNQLTEQSLYNLQTIEHLFSEFLSTNIFPNELKNIEFKLKDSFYNEYTKDTPKYITGVACVGKSTILEHLNLNGWSTPSRGSLGIFAGKAKNPATISGLHSALQLALTKYNAVGDRGLIDNPIWTFIMQMCDPNEIGHDFLGKFMNFISSSFNKLSLMEFANHKVVVIIETNTECNVSRMTSRASGGDLYRSRLPYYVHSQAMAYFLIGKLLNWKILYLQYDDNLKCTNFTTNKEEVSTFYGDPDPDKEELPRYIGSKVDDLYDVDMRYPKNYGIYK